MQNQFLSLKTNWRNTKIVLDGTELKPNNSLSSQLSCSEKKELVFSLNSVFCDKYLPVLTLASAIKLVSLMSKDYVKLKMEKICGNPWNCGELFKEWALENDAFIKEYKFIDCVPTEEYKGSKIPMFSETEMSFFRHVVKKISPDDAPFEEMVIAWLAMVHKARDEISKAHMDDELIKLMEIMKRLMVDEPTLLCTWETQFLNISKIEDLKTLRMHDDETLNREISRLI